MGTAKSFENYPATTVMLSGLLSLSIYLLGFLVILQSGLVFSLIYLLYILLLETRLIKNHCTSCYYWGKTCGFGKGRISSWFFRKGDPEKFCRKSFTWKDMIPDLLVTLAPLITGIVLLILDFNYIILSELLLIIALTTLGNSYVRGTLTCSSCKQRDLGCPAAQLFKVGQASK